MKRSGLRGIPSVDKLAHRAGRYGIASPYRRSNYSARTGCTAQTRNDTWLRGQFSRTLRSALGILRASRIQPVINGTGILVHTNFGRAPLGPAVMEAVSRIGSQYNNLEYGLAEGGRGGRAAYLEHNLALLCGSEAATVVNNNASALVLILRHFCKRRDACH